MRGREESEFAFEKSKQMSGNGCRTPPRMSLSRFDFYVLLKSKTTSQSATVKYHSKSHPRSDSTSPRRSSLQTRPPGSPFPGLAPQPRALVSDCAGAVATRCHRSSALPRGLPGISEVQPWEQSSFSKSSKSTLLH